MSKIKNCKTNASALKQAAFTLIELSIVLVIIGLIVGGILVGQDLIRAAEIRATVSQVEKYNSAVNTFRTKYNGIPGDMLAANVSALGLCPTAGCIASPGTGLGDGNGLITDTGGSNANTAAGETLLFWQQLSAANLIDGSVGSAITTAGALGTSPTIDQYLPSAKVGRGNYWAVGSDQGFNYYVLAGFGGFSSATYSPINYAVNPLDAYNIDIKLDDGIPYTGIVQARGKVSTAFQALVDANDASSCVTGGAATNPASTYNRSGANATTPYCVLRFRFN